MNTRLSIADPERTPALAGKPHKIEFANSLRGLACLCVVFAHYAGVFWEAPGAVSGLTGMPAYEVTAAQMPAVNWLDNAVPNLQWGPFGVAVFFLVSGFVIPFSVGRYTALQFFVNRVLRIWPTYVCGFAVTIVMITLGSWTFGGRAPFEYWELLVHAIPGIRDLVGSKNIDGIIWTLEIEVKFYALCLLASAWIRKSSPLIFAIPLLLGISALVTTSYFAVLPPAMMRLATEYINTSQFLVFMFVGVAFHYLYTGAMDGKQTSAWIASLAMVMCLVWSNSPYKSTFPLAWSYGFAACLFAWAMSTPQLLRSNRLLDFIAAISYPLYVVHGVAGYVIMRWLFAAGVPASINILMTLVATTTTAYAIHRTVELPSQAFAKRMMASLERTKEVNAVDRQAA